MFVWSPAYISDISWVPILPVICITSSTQKICSKNSSYHWVVLYPNIFISHKHLFMCGADLNQRFIFSMVLLPVLSNTSDLYPCFSLWSAHAKWYITCYKPYVTSWAKASIYNLHLWFWSFNGSEDLLGKTQKFQIYRIVKVKLTLLSLQIQSCYAIPSRCY